MKENNGSQTMQQKNKSKREKRYLLVFTCFFSERIIQHKPFPLRHREHFSNCVKIMTKKQVTVRFTSIKQVKIASEIPKTK